MTATLWNFLRTNDQPQAGGGSGCPSDCPEEEKFGRLFHEIRHLLVNEDDNRGNENAEMYHKIMINRIWVSSVLSIMSP